MLLEDDCYGCLLGACSGLAPAACSVRSLRYTAEVSEALVKETSGAKEGREMHPALCEGAIDSLLDLCRYEVGENACRTTLRRRAMRDDHMRVLHCHDMRGGYQEDAWAPPLPTTPSTSGRRSTSSCTSPTISSPFPYPLLFSHAPSPHPANWIQAAHLNGVPILGTFIVEGNNDQLLYQLLTGPDPSPHNPKFDPFFADRLASLCEQANFDGYLVNIETRSVPTPLIRPFQEFLKELRLKLKALSPECQVIWYDSVDANGALNFQNQLNAKNRAYFNNCDGIFLNYWWQPGDLVVTRQNAGNRFDFVRSLTSSKRDVYVGVDV
ncbi:hypothetical protein BLSTO_05729, partial [Blastocystis sp. subtype 1]